MVNNARTGITRREMLGVLSVAPWIPQIVQSSAYLKGERNIEESTLENLGYGEYLDFYKNMRTLEILGCADFFGGAYEALKQVAQEKDPRDAEYLLEGWTGLSLTSISSIEQFAKVNIDEVSIYNWDSSKPLKPQQNSIKEMLRRLSIIYPKITGLIVGSIIYVNSDRIDSTICMTEVPTDLDSLSDKLVGLYKGLAHEIRHLHDPYQGKLHKPEELETLKKMLSRKDYIDYITAYSEALVEMVASMNTMSEDIFICQKNGSAPIELPYFTRHSIEDSDKIDAIGKMCDLLANAESIGNKEFNIAARKKEIFDTTGITYFQNVDETTYKNIANRLYYRAFKLLFESTEDPEEKRQIVETLKPMYRWAIEEFSHDILGSIGGLDEERTGYKDTPIMKARRKVEEATLRLMGWSKKSAEKMTNDANYKLAAMRSSLLKHG